MSRPIEKARRRKPSRQPVAKEAKAGALAGDLGLSYEACGAVSSLLEDQMSARQIADLVWKQLEPMIQSSPPTKGEMQDLLSRGGTVLERLGEVLILLRSDVESRFAEPPQTEPAKA